MSGYEHQHRFARNGETQTMSKAFVATDRELLFEF
jgi:hypothetical protein